MVKQVSDNDYTTYSPNKSYTIDIRRKNAATKVTHVFVKGWNIASYVVAGTHNRTMPSDTSRFGFQHDLFKLPTVVHAESVSVVFTGTDTRIYALMLLEAAYELDIDKRFVSDRHSKIERAGGLHQDVPGELTRYKRRGGTRWGWKSEYSLLFQDDAYDDFFSWLEVNPDVVFAQGTQIPHRIYPAAVMGMDFRAEGRSSEKSAGSILDLTIEEDTGIGPDTVQRTSQDNAAPVYPMPNAIRNASANNLVVGEITVSWTAPSNATEAGVTMYRWRQVGAGTWNEVTATSFVVRNVADRLYNFEVQAVGLSGNSVSVRVSILGRPIPAPNPVRTLLVSSPTFNTISIAFREPENADIAQVSRYEHRISTEETWIRVARGSAESYTLRRTGIAGRAAAYTVQVRVVGVSGNSQIVSAQVIVSNRPLPQPPATFAATSPAFNRVRLAYTAPANAVDAAVSHYEYKLSTAGSWTRAPSASFLLPAEVAAGAYTYELRAVGVTGNGAVATASVTVADHPLPTAVLMPRLTTSKRGTIRIDWNPPANAADAEIQEYAYREQATPANAWVSSGTARSVIINTGIEDRAYTFEIRARGTSGWALDANIATATGTGVAWQEPGEVRNIALTSPGDNNIRLSIDPPMNRSLANVTHYEYRVQDDFDSMTMDDPDEAWMTFGNTRSETQTITFGGSFLPILHTIEVRAVGPRGEGDEISDTVVVTTSLTNPQPPGTVTATSPTYNTVRLSWVASSTANIVWYEYKRTADTEWIRGSTALTAILTGVPAGDFTFDVRALSLGGYSTVSTSGSVAVTPPPDPPEDIIALAFTAAYYQVTVTWDAPSNIAEAVLTNYQWRRQTGVDAENNPVWTAWALSDDLGQTRSVTITHLRNTAVTVQVRANTLGGLTDNAEIDVTANIRPLPLAPTTPAPTITDAGVTLTWGAPTNAPDAEILNYEYQSSTASTWTEISVLTVDIDIETAGNYIYRVRAVGREGAGTSVNIGFTIAPRPLAVTSIMGDVTTAGQAIITFAAPSNAVAAGVTGYQSREKVAVGETENEWSDTFTMRTFTVVERSGGEFTYEIRAVGTRVGTDYGEITVIIALAGPAAPTDLGILQSTRSVSIFLFTDPPTNDEFTIVRRDYSTSTPTTWANITSVAGGTSGTPGRWAVPLIGLSGTFTVAARVIGEYGTGDDAIQKEGDAASIEWTAGGGSVGDTSFAPYLTVPDSPVISASAELRGLYIAWYEPNTGGLPITNYRVTAEWLDDPDNPNLVFTENTTNTNIEMQVVRNRNYELSVYASNALGEGTAAPIEFFIPFAPPEAVTNLHTVYTTVQGRLFVSWGPPENSTELGSYSYEYRLNDDTTWTNTTDRVLSLTGLTPGSNSVYIRVINEINERGPTSSITGTVLGETPSRITNLRYGTISTTSWGFLWDPPANAVAADIQSYDIRKETENTWTSVGTSRSYTHTWALGETSVTYYVRAVGIHGPAEDRYADSEDVRISNFTGNTLPGVVSSLSADTSVEDQVTIRWTAPANTAPVTQYNYTISSWVPGTVFAPNTSVTLTLPAGQYRFNIQAVNRNGAGPIRSIVFNVTS